MMDIHLTEAEIAGLIAERKPLPANYRTLLQVKPKRGHKERELDFKGAAESDFRLILRQSDFNPLDFSVILAYRPPKSNRVFRLRRYNGKSHEHTNKLEGQKFYEFHIHKATERYQDSGIEEDGYAEPTRMYANFQDALQCMFNDCGFDIPLDPQHTLF